MTTGLPPYDLALDEHSVALSYILMASGKSIAAVAPAAPAPAAAAPKKVTKKVRVVLS